MDSHDKALLARLGGDTSGETAEEQEKEFVRVLRQYCIEMGSEPEKINSMDLLHLKITRLQLSHMKKDKTDSASESDSSPAKPKSEGLVDSPSQLPSDVPFKSTKEVQEVSKHQVGILETKDDSGDEASPANRKMASSAVKKFKIYRSSSDHSAKKKVQFTSIASNTAKTKEKIEDQSTESLMRTLVRFRRKKKILSARLESLRVQEGLTFALENHLDAKRIHDVRQDLKVACTNIRTPFLTKKGPLLPVLRALRLRREEIEWIRGINEMGWKAYLEYMQELETDSKTELIAVQQQYAQNRKIIEEEKELIASEQNDGKPTASKSRSLNSGTYMAKMEEGQANSSSSVVFTAPPPSSKHNKLYGLT